MLVALLLALVSLKRSCPTQCVLVALPLHVAGLQLVAPLALVSQKPCCPPLLALVSQEPCCPPSQCVLVAGFPLEAFHTRDSSILSQLLVQLAKGLGLLLKALVLCLGRDLIYSNNHLEPKLASLPDLGFLPAASEVLACQIHLHIGRSQFFA